METLQAHIGVGTMISIDPNEFELFQDTLVHNFYHDEDAVSRIQNAFVITDITNGNLEIEAIDRYLVNGSEIMKKY